MENYHSVTITPPVEAPNIPIAGGVTGACSEERKAQLESMVKGLPLDSRAMFIAMLPLAVPYIVAEALMKVIEKLNPKNWPIFKFIDKD